MDSIDKQFVGLYQKIGRAQGMDDSFIEIFALLYIEPDEIAMDELVKKTGYSLASISNKIKMLEALGFVKKVRKPGSKKIFLKIEKSIGGLMKEGMLMKERSVISTIINELPKIIEDFKPKTEIEKRKLRILEKYYKEMLLFEKLMQKWVIDIEKMLKMDDAKE